MKVLDLFAGLGGWSAPFLERGHEVYRIDNDPRFEVESHADILTLTAADLPWRPDIILASPPCESFSVLTIGRNWAPGRVPKTDGARLAIALVEATRRLIDDLRPAYFVVENPRAMLRTLPMLADLERRTVTYCQYGEPFMKPTDLWGGFPPSFVARPKCRPLATCHVAAPRGSRTGIQGDGVLRYKGYAVPPSARVGTHLNVGKMFGGGDRAALRAVIPYELALDVCLAAERDLAAGAKPIPTMLWGVA
jgi:hypothetical protein